MDTLVKWFDEYKLMAQIRSGSTEAAESMIKAAKAGGIHLFQISMNTPQALRLIETYSKEKNILVGTGNVTDGEVAQRAINVGAKFVSIPYTDSEIVRVAQNNNCWVLQGATTPTEVSEAFKLGADLITIWPASLVGGVELLRKIKATMPYARLLAQGGINAEDMFEYLKHCSGIIVRSVFFERGLVRSNSWTEITSRIKELTQKLESLKISKA